MPEPDTTPAAVIHACPPDGSGLTPCCRRPPFELARTDRMTTDPDAVTCASPWRILGANPDQPYRHGTTPGTSGRTETGATTANVQVTDGEAGGDLRAGVMKVLGIGSPTVTDHDLIEHIRAALIYRFRADQEVLLKDAALTRVQEIGRRLIAHAKGFQDVLDDTDRGPWTRTVAADLVELEAALTPPADQDRGGQ